MPKIILKTLIAVLLVCGCASAAQEIPHLESLPEVVAEVDRYKITKTELLRELVSMGAAVAVDRLARRMLVEQACEKGGIAVSEDDLDAQLRIEEITLRNEMRLVPGEVNERGFEDLVRARFQMTMQEYRDEVVRIKLLAQKVIGKDLHIGGADLVKFFRFKPYKPQSQYLDTRPPGRRNRILEDLTVEDMLQEQARYHAAHILITPLSPTDMYRGTRLKTHAGERAAVAAELAEKRQKLQQAGIEVEDPELVLGPEWRRARQRAEECLAELKNQRLTWEQAVIKYSQDPHDMHATMDGKRQPSQREQESQKVRRQHVPGDVGWFTRDGPLVEEFYEGAKKLRSTKELTGPVLTQFGYHIIKLIEDVQVPKQKTFEELRPQVQKIYTSWLLQSLTDKWMERLVLEAKIENAGENLRAMLWPPDPARGKETDPDPVVGKINGTPLKRSQVWRELVRSDGPEALDRLINREMALGPLKRLGPDRLEWMGRPPELRQPPEPAMQPLEVTAPEMDLQLTEDRLALDRLNTEAKKADPGAKPKTLDEYVYERFGKGLPEYLRALEAGTIMGKAIRSRADLDESRLLLEYNLAKETYRVPSSFDISHYMLKLNPDISPLERENFLKLVQSLNEDLKDGKISWDDLVAKSDHKESRDVVGRLGTLRQGAGPFPELYDELVKGNWEPRQALPPIMTADAIHIVRLHTRHPDRIPEFAEVRGQVERDYLRGRAAIYLDVWLRSMKSQAAIKRYIFEPETLQIPEQLPLPQK